MSVKELRERINDEDYDRTLFGFRWAVQKVLDEFEQGIRTELVHAKMGTVVSDQYVASLKRLLGGEEKMKKLKVDGKDAVFDEEGCIQSVVEEGAEMPLFKLSWEDDEK